MKDIIGRPKIKSTNLPRKLEINNVGVYNKPKIADAFNDFFTNIGQRLDSQIPKSSKTFETCINKVNAIMVSKPLPINELKDAFFLLKIKKARVLMMLVLILLKNALGVLCEALIYLISAISLKGSISRSFKNCESNSNL